MRTLTEATVKAMRQDEDDDLALVLHRAGHYHLDPPVSSYGDAYQEIVDFLEDLNRQLAPHGLELLDADLGTSDLFIKVVKKEQR